MAFLTRREKIQQNEVLHSWLQRKFDVATLYKSCKAGSSEHDGRLA
ncbi:hypothetical protein J9317_04405 [Metabacillus sp. KIGAM252]|uniref:Uncharacterized protein n=1 Tax=Metabacillus flavus TaxID=2823519 RepID=A0ABS5LC42_9BACI|nr:hypothetical protein [Metabacillus flavus]MBS2967999.1 hypothetical protein [Metabacillus flavus]